MRDLSVSKIFVAATSTLFLLIGFLPAIVSAAPAGVSISPSINEITLGSGLLTSDTKITVTNTTDKAMTVTFSVADVTANAKGEVTLQDPQPDQKTSLAKWMSISPSEPQLLPANGSVTVTVSIANSADMAPGGHYGAVIATVSGSASSGGKVGLKQQLAANFLATKAGNETYQLTLRDISAVAFRDVPARIELPFESTGNTHVVPRGTVSIYDSNKRLIAKGVINDGSQVVFPGTDRKISVDLQRLAPLSEHGKFQAVISYRHDKTDQFQTQAVDFTRGLPWLGRAVTVVATILGVMIIIAVMTYIRHIRRTSRP